MRFVVLASLFIASAFASGREIGPPVGTAMPEFELKDQMGKSRSLRSLLGPDGLVLVFYRSADWCPYCKSQLMQLNENKHDLLGRGVNVAGISYDSVEVLRQFSERRRIGFPLLADEQSAFMRRLGLVNAAVPPGDAYYGIPYPCSIVLDREGIVKAKLFEDAYHRGDTFADLMRSEFDAVPSNRKSEFSGKHLRVTAKASRFLVNAGDRVSITLDIHPEPGVHVYGEQAEGYTPIRWTFKPSAVTAATSMRTPTASPISVGALETVPGYSETFQLRGTLVVGSEDALRSAVDETGRFRVEGLLRYQACDERVCYPPMELRCSWQFRYALSDQVRAVSRASRGPRPGVLY